MDRSAHRGFTLVELLVVISIIAILSSVGMVVYSSAQKSGRISKRIQDLKALAGAIELYKNSTGYYPDQASWGCIGNLSGTESLTPTYMQTIPSDPLDGSSSGSNCYQYRSDLIANSNEFKVRTNGNLSGGEMNSSYFQQQSTLIDPARDGTANCSIETGGNITGWAIYSGTTACGY